MKINHLVIISVACVLLSLSCEKTNSSITGEINPDTIKAEEYGDSIVTEDANEDYPAKEEEISTSKIKVVEVKEGTIKAEELKYGNLVEGFEVINVQYKVEDNIIHFTCDFVGSAILSGDYIYIDDSDELLSGLIYFMPDEESWELIPEIDLYEGDRKRFQIVFQNDSDVLQLGEMGSTGNITLSISQIEFAYLPMESWNVIKAESIIRVDR